MPRFIPFQGEKSARNRGFAIGSLAFYNRAKSPGLYPAGSYMLANGGEYFAMTASVFLHGSAARDPFTRQNLKDKQPLYYNWLEREFGRR